MGQMKKRFDIFLKASGLSTKGDEQKVGILLHTIGDDGVDVYDNFEYLPARQVDGDDLPAESKNNYNCVVRKFDDYFTKRDPQLMLRERFWMHLKREPGQSFDSWVNTIKERSAECKFPRHI